MSIPNQSLAQALSALRSSTEFNAFIDSLPPPNSNNPANNPLYRIIRIIINHFNTMNSQFNPSNKTLVLYVGDISDEDRTALEVILLSKGYSVHIQNNTRIIITP